VVLSAPELLIAFRAICAPAIFVFACFGFPGPVLAAILLCAFLSDVFDGVIARRLGIATPGLRFADTLVDTIFYVTAAVALRVAVPGVFDNAGVAVTLLIVIHVSRTTFEVTKFGRIASYHMWSSKALGVLMVVTMSWSFLSGRPTPLVAVTLWAGIANEVEGFAASVILPAWQADIPTLMHAWRARPDASPGANIR
jgi:CDP-diacylglycerol--glycerol-3-phosphate 3-phosphatidyltransferase